MAENIVPINELSSLGVVKDTPTVGLAPNAFTGVNNVRFRDNAVWKMKGEEVLTADLNCGTAPSSGSFGKILYIAWWSNPNLTPDDGYYIFIVEQKNSSGTVVGNRVFLKKATDSSGSAIEDITPSSLNSNNGFAPTGNWQHTEFSGGYVIILNNGIDKPHYLRDVLNNTNIADVPDLKELPGWDSYNVREKLIERTFALDTEGATKDDFLLSFDLGFKIDFTNTELYVSYLDVGVLEYYNVTPVLTGESGESGTINGSNYVPANFPTIAYDSNGVITTPAQPTTNVGNSYKIYTDTTTNSTRLWLGTNFVEGDVICVYMKSRNIVNVRCGVVRAFGNLLVAGNLIEQDSSNNSTVRNMTGVVRTSDVAAPGAIPTNWNPFSVGVNTADEFTLSSTSVIQDMQPLGDNLFIYTNNSIHVMRLTGSITAPVSFRPVTYQYGCAGLNKVIEFKGRHLIVGSNDIYTFSGNAANIESVADMRIRNYFYDNLDRNRTSKIFLLLNQAHDEIWINYPKIGFTSPECNEAIIYNYKFNTWTIRSLNNISSGVMAPIVGDGVSNSDRPWANNKINMNRLFPVLTQECTSNFSHTGSAILAADIGYKHRQINNNYSNYNSAIERKGLSATPEFKTEQFNSVALLTQGSGTLTISTTASNAPAAMPDNFNSPDKSGSFSIATDYKHDLRLNGRFISYKIDDGTSTSTSWSLTGLQLAIQEGGTR